jgi:cysteinyl-tRNA synthetase, unknown class
MTCVKCLVLACCVLLACTRHGVPPALAQAQPPTDAASSPAHLLAAAKSWGYQLQNIDPDVLAGAPHDVIVIDYSRDGTDALALTAEEVARLRVKPDGSPRIVLSYLSIGEAETYRSYWKWYWGWFFGLFAPRWLAQQNREWRGNYGVRYWQDDWQKIIVGGEGSYIDRIIKAGFDGVYLDKVDEYEQDALAKENPNLRADMIAFVKALAAHARARKPGFLVVPQNGEELLRDASYRAVIDGLGKENLLFGEMRDKEASRPQDIDFNVANLKLLTGDRKPVFAVEYLDDPRLIANAKKRLLDYGFIPHFADRALDTMRIGDLPDPNRKSDGK